MVQVKVHVQELEEVQLHIGKDIVTDWGTGRGEGITTRRGKS